LPPGILETKHRERRSKRPPIYLWGGAAFVVVAAIALAVFTQRSATREFRSFVDFGEAVPIATERGVERSPALSPDGTHIVFSWSGESGENINLYVQNIDGSGRVRLTSDPGPDRFPKWSPDGRTIAFIRAGELFSMPAIGGPQRRITTAAGDGLSWSPDSRTLAVSDHESNDGSLSLYLVSDDTGIRRRLTFPAVSKQQDLWPAFDAKGDQVAFVRRTTTTDDVFRVPAAGGRATRLALPGRPLHGLAWTPDGSFVLAATGRQAPGLLVIPAGAHDQTRIKRLDIAGSDVYEPSVIARNGSPKMDLAFAHETSNWDVLGMPIQGSAVTPTPLIASIRNDQAPSFSPDGKWLAFNSARSGYEEIWISRADGSESRQVTHFNSGLASSPRWSPDGQRIAFDATIDSNRDIYVVRGDGGVPQRITRELSSEGQPSWSHDGRWIYFMSDRSGSRQIWKMSAGGGAPVQLTQQGGYQALEAADGKYLYYAKRRRGAGLWRVSVNGGGESMVSDAVWQNLWSIAGDYIFYFDLGGLFPAVFDAPRAVPLKRLNPADGQTTTLGMIVTDLPDGVPALDVRPDGKYLTWVSRREHTSEIMLIRSLSISAR
jgi:Tol biopolymer transport system component